MNDTLIFSAFLFIGVYGLAVIGYLAFKQTLKLKQTAMELDAKVRMDDWRSHLEKGVASLNADFASTPDRFEELNHMALSGQSEITSLAISRPTQSAFLQAHGITLSNVKIQPHSIFVLTPFHEDYDAFFNALKEIGRDVDYQVSRGDERVAKSDIFTQVLMGIVSSRFVIANITGRNANVFYELGVAHALDKEVILIAESKAEVPFDLQSKRIIFYDDLGELQKKVLTAITRMAKV